MLKAIAITTLTLTLSGCQAIGEIAYDFQADKEASRCESIISQTDRQACLARAREVDRQASEVRKSR
jgi:hypothetical protein